MDQLIACLAVVGFVVALFFFGDRLLAGDRKRELGGWLIDELPAEARVDALPKAFIEWFDQLFKTRSVRVFRIRAGRARALGGTGSQSGIQLDLPSFWRSALASFLALVAATVVWVANKGGFSQPPTSGTNISLLVLLYGGATVVTNIIPDYLSLVESRFVLGKMSQTRSLLGKLAWLTVDVVSTAAIVFCFLWGSAYLLLPLVPEDSLYAVGCLTRDSFDLDRMIDIAIAGLTFSTPSGTINYDVSGIYIFSSFFTSFWVWLYLGSSLLVRLAQLIPGLRGFLRRACRVQDYPLRVLAVVSGIVAFGLFLLPSAVAPLLPAERRGTNGMDGNIGQIELCMDMRARRLGWDDAAPPDADFSDLAGWSKQLQIWVEYRRAEQAWRDGYH